MSVGAMKDQNIKLNLIIKGLDKKVKKFKERGGER